MKNRHEHEEMMKSFDENFDATVVNFLQIMGQVMSDPAKLRELCKDKMEEGYAKFGTAILKTPPNILVDEVVDEIIDGVNWTFGRDEVERLTNAEGSNVHALFEEDSVQFQGASNKD